MNLGIPVTVNGTTVTVGTGHFNVGWGMFLRNEGLTVINRFVTPVVNDNTEEGRLSGRTEVLG